MRQGETCCCAQLSNGLFHHSLEVQPGDLIPFLLRKAHLLKDLEQVGDLGGIVHARYGGGGRNPYLESSVQL